MKCLVVTALVVAAVGSSVPVGPHTVVHVPAAPLHYQASYPVGALPVAVPCADAAALMSAWNVAASKANTIETVLLKSFPSGRITVNVPTQLKATEEVEKATAQFMSAWNEATRRVPEVQNVLYTLQPTKQTAEVQKATREFMSAWEAAANQASTIKQAVTLSSDPNAPIPQQVEATDEVKKATKEFMKAWNDAASRVPTIETTMYQISGTVASPHATHTLGSAPHFTPSVKQATAEFMKAWNAAAAAAEAAPDVNIITGASHWQSGTVTPAVVTYGSAPAAPVHGVLQQVLPTPEVQKATAEFMAAWNLAAAKATQIQSSLVHPTSRGIFTVHVPEQVQATHEVQRSTAEFMEAWNKAAGQAVTVEAAVYSLPQPVQETDAVKQATAEFMAAWEAAAQQASTIRKAILVTADPYSAAPKQVEATEEVKKATREFMTAWNKAAARVPTIETTMYQISGTVPSPHATHTLGSVPQFTPSVEQATADFMKAWNAAAAAAAAAPDVNIITGASQLQSSVAHVVVPSSPSVVTYGAAPAAPVHSVPQPVQPTPEVQKATAEFMAAWNLAAARATQIQSSLVYSSPRGTLTVHVPEQVQATQQVQKATAEFMEAWNKAAGRVQTVEAAVYSLPQPVQETEAVKQATAEFMAAWEAAAQQASTIRKAILVTADPYSAAPKQVEATEEVKKATREFMTAWNKAAARVPTIETTMYQISGTVASPHATHTLGSVPQFTPSVEQATADFMKAWSAAAAAAAAAPDVNIITGASQLQSTVAHVAVPSSPSVVTYDAAPAVPVDSAPQPVQSTPEVQKATAEFMAAWNLAAAKATEIQSSLVYTSPRGTFTVHVPEQVQATQEVQRATADFMETWNKAAGRAVTVEAAVYSLPQPVQETKAVKQATAEFMAAWEAAAQQASTIRKAILVTGDPYSAAPKQVEATEEVKKATREFMTAWNKAAARVPTIETTMYQISGTVASPHATRTLGSAQQFTPSVEQATADFMRAWNAAAAAAAAAPDVNIITGASHQAGSAVHIVGPAAPSVVTYDAASVAPVQGVPQPVQPTPDVQRATAEFMAAWNAAAERATKIHAVVKSYDHDPSTGSPIEVTETDAVKQATREFMAAWNAAARRANVVVEYAVQAPQETPEVKKATSEFMTAWHAAAERASTIGQTVSLAQTAALPQQVDTTADVKAATAEFMSAWNEAAARVPTIETTLYTLSGSQAIAAPGVLAPVSDTPEVKAAKESFMIKFRAAEDAALRTPITRGVLPVPNTVVTTLPIHHVPYNVGAVHVPYTLSNRIFAPFSGLPLYVKDCP